MAVKHKLSGKVVGIDPGGTTGVAEIEYRGVETLVYTFTDTDGSALEEYFETTWTPGTAVVVEGAPQWDRHDAERTRRVEDIVERHVGKEKINWVSPSQWKGSPHAKAAPVPARVPVHVRDACRMAHYWKTITRRSAG